MDIFLIRHTKADTEIGLCYGQSDVPLAGSFKAEAQAVLEKLPELSEGCLVFSSPLTRCKKLAQTFRMPFKTDDRLLELDFGDWENCRFNDVDDGLLKDWTENFVSVPPPNGETFNDLCRRVGHFWDELVVTTQTDQILLVTHAGVIRALLVNILQLPPVNAFKFRVDTGSVHKLKYLNGYTYIHYLNH